MNGALYGNAPSKKTDYGNGRVGSPPSLHGRFPEHGIAGGFARVSGRHVRPVAAHFATFLAVWARGFVKAFVLGRDSCERLCA
jgi:hypothetical protein